MLLALASGLESGGVLWGKSIGKDYSRGSPQWIILFLLCSDPQVCEESRPDTIRNSVRMVRYEWDDGYLLGKKKKVFQALKEFSR